MALANLIVKIGADIAELQSGVDKSAKILEKTNASVEALAKQFVKLETSFSGDKIRQDAQQVTDAIGKIGGASKLTESEQKSVNATLTEALSKYKALGIEAPSQMVALAEATKKIEPPLTLAQKAAGLLSSAFGQFTLAGLATQAISKLSDGIGEFVSTGLKLPAMQQSFNRLTSSINQDAGKMLSGMNEATRGLVSDYDLMASANKAMLLGLPVTSESMGELAKTATILGKAMGQDATKSLDDLITALGRSSPMILDNLGLTVKVGEANEAYAKSLGKTSDQLSQSEQKMAFYQAAMEAAKRKTAELGDQTRTLGEIAESVWVKFGNVVSATAANINTGLGAAVSSGKNFVDFLSDMIKFGGGAAITMSNLREQIDAVEASRKSKLGKDVDLSLPVDPFIALRKEAEKLRSAAIVPLTSAQKELIVAFDAGGTSATKIAEKLSVSERAVSTFLDANKKAKSAVNEHAKSLKDLSDVLSGSKMAAQANLTVEALSKLPPVSKLNAEAQKQISATMEDAIKSYQKAGIVVPKVWQDIADAARQPLKATKDFAGYVTQFINDLPSTLKSVNLSSLQFPPIDVDSVKQARQKIVDTMKAGNGLFADIFGSPRQLGAQVADTIIGAIQGGGDVLAAAGSLIGSKLGKHIGESLGDFFSKTGASAFSKALGGMFEAVLPGIGALLGPLLGKIGGAISGLFDRNKGRDIVNEFASSLGGFDELHKKLNELGAEGEKLWIRLTQGVGRNNPEQAKEAVDAVTEALDKQKTVSEDLAKSTTENANKQVEALRQLMAPDELAALAKGYQSAMAEGFKGTEDEFLRSQLALYSTVEEGDARLKTYFYSSTLSAMKLIEAGQADVATKMIGHIRDLDTELNGLWKSVESEAPEESMGIVEQQTRERIKSITEERNLAARALDETARAAAEGAEKTAQTIQDTLDAHDFVARVRFELGDIPSIGGGERPEGYATGTRGAYLDFGAGTHVVLHGRERIVTEGEELGLDGGTVTLSAPDAMALLQGQIVRVARKDAAKGGVRTRAGRGRSY